MRPTKAVRLRLAAVVLVPYIVSLGLPAVTGDIDGPNTTAPGVQALLMGFIINPVAWLANVFLIVGFRRFNSGRMKPAVRSGAAGAGCALLPFIWSQGLALEVGYYVWFGSMVLFLAGATLGWRRNEAPGTPWRLWP